MVEEAKGVIAGIAATRTFVFAIEGSVVPVDVVESRGGETLSLPSEASEVEVPVLVPASITEAKSSEGGDPLGSDIGIDSVVGANPVTGSVLLLAKTPAAADGVKTKETV